MRRTLSLSGSNCRTHRQSKNGFNTKSTKTRERKVNNGVNSFSQSNGTSFCSVPDPPFFFGETSVDSFSDENLSLVIPPTKGKQLR